MSAGWHNVVEQVSKDRDLIAASRDAQILAILAGEGGTLFGRRVEFTVSFPDGMPMGWKDEAEMREWASGELARVRERMTR